MKDLGIRLSATAGHSVRFRSPQNRRSRPIRSYRALEDLAFAYAGLGRKTEAIRSLASAPVRVIVRYATGVSMDGDTLRDQIGADNGKVSGQVRSNSSISQLLRHERGFWKMTWKG